MPRLNYSMRQLAKGVRKIGIDYRRGKHFNGWYELGGKQIHPVNIGNPHEGVNKLVLGNVRKQLWVDDNGFDRLLRCPMKGPEYARLVRTRLAREGN